MIYVASPYSHPSAVIRHERCEIAESFAAFWVQRGKEIYCPIASWHHIAVRHNMPKDFSFWQRLDTKFLRLASELWVLMIDGWEDSVGVQWEINMARQLMIPIRYFSEDHFGEVALASYTSDEEAAIKGM